MMTDKTQPRRFRAFLLSLSALLFSLLLIRFSFAEEPRLATSQAVLPENQAKVLKTFEQEIILAKQKQQTFSGKLSASQGALDRERSKQLEEEAARLMSELSKKAAFGSVTDVKPSLQSQEIQIEAAPVKKKKAPAEKKKAWYENFPNPFTRGQAEFKAPDLNVSDSSVPSEGRTLYAVAVSDKKITATEAVDVALANNAQVQADKRKIEVAEAKLAEAKRAMLPVVQGTFDKNGGRSPSGGRTYVGQSQKINISQPLYYGGELVNTVKQGEEALRQARAEYEKNRNEFVHQVRAAYYGAVKAEYNAQYQVDLEQGIRDIYIRSQKEWKEKLIAEVDYLNVESQYYQVAFQTEAARNDGLSAMMVLRSLMGLTGNEAINLDLELHFKKISMGFSDLLKLAYHNNGDLKSKLHALASAYYGVEVYRSKKLPRFDLRGSFGLLGETFDDESPLPLDLEKEWFMGVHGSMPLGANSMEYDFGRHFYGPTISAFQGSEDWRHHLAFNVYDRLSDITDTKNAEANYLQAQSDFEKSKNDVLLKVREDFYTMRKSMIQVDSAMAKLKYQLKQSAILEYLVGNQEASITNYVESLIQHAQDRFSFIQAVTDYEIAKSSLSASIGDPYYFDNPNES